MIVIGVTGTPKSLCVCSPPHDLGKMAERDDGLASLLGQRNAWTGKWPFQLGLWNLFDKRIALGY